MGDLMGVSVEAVLRVVRSQLELLVEQAVATERARNLFIVRETTVPLGGFHLGDRNHFVAFNLGRWQEAVTQRIENPEVSE